ncbi:beta strand repeat-containing protein, partial [Neisseria sp. P0015.S010]
TSGNVAAGDNSAVTGGAVNTAINTAINTAVTDLKDAGFKIGADSGADDTVKLGETVKYAGDANIKTTVTNNQIGFKLADSITVGPASGGSPVTVDGTAGTVTGLTNKTWNPAGIVSGRAATEDQLKAVTNQVNSSATHYYSVNDGGGAHGGNFNNDGATGLNALAAGVGASAQDNDAVAIGSGTIAQGNGSIAIGAAAEVSGATGAGGIAIGAAATAKNGGTAVGSGADTGNGTALIPGLPNRLNNNLALGDSARVKNDTNFNVALGSLSTAGDADLTAAAYKPNATSVIAGDINEAGVKYGEVSLGGDTSHFMSGSKMYRRLTNLAAGSADTDAVNVSQLKAVQAALQDQAPVAYTKADGTKVYKHTDGNFYDAPNGAGNQVAAADVITSLQNAAGSTTAPTTLANVKDNLADTAAAVTNPTGNDRTTLSANKGHNAATVNDVLNAGFTVQGNGVDEDFVTHGDTVNFVNGQGTVANVSSTGGVTTVKFDTPMTYVDTAGTPATTPSNKVNLVGTGGPVTLGNVAAGAVNATSTDAVNGSQLYKTANSTATHLGGGSAVQADGSISAPTYTLANATGTPTNYSNVGDALTALNARTNAANAGWKFQVNSGAAETIKPNDTVGFKDGTNIAITNNGKDITIATKPNLTADSLTINNGPVINGNGISTNGKNIDMGNNGKITNLTSGNVAAGDNSAVTGGAVNTAINTA